MVHTRETRASASEIKFVIDPRLAQRIREWARRYLDADPHGSGLFSDEYDVASLYFDTLDKDVFNRRRSFARAKYRVRRYGASDVVFLERKLRRPGLLVKRRTVAPLSALVHLHEDGEGAWGGEWFKRRLVARGLRPVCQVAYRRTARVIDTADGPARLTLDCGLGVATVTDARFATGGDVPFLEHAVVLEVKYRVQLPALFRRLVEEFALEPQSASKYRLGMAALGHVAVSSPTRVPAGTEAESFYA